MSQKNSGNFFVAELPDGRFVAASSHSPYFCFRAESEEAVLEKVRKALTFFGKTDGIEGKITLKSVTQHVTTLRPTKKLRLNELAQFEAA